MRWGLSAWISLFLVPSVATAQVSTIPVEHRQAGGGAVPVTASTPDLMAAHFINVGQGSASLFEFSCGLVLIDTGGQSEGPTDWQDRLIKYLNAVFERRPELNRTIDAVYLTHPHPDHVLGVKRLITDSPYTIRHVITDAEKGATGQKALINYANLNRIPAAQITTDQISPQKGLWSRYIDPLRCRGADPDFTVLWGSYTQRARWPKAAASNANNHSVAVRIRFGESSFLVTGDMQEKSIQTLLERSSDNRKLLDVDIYVAGHHGSHNGTTEPFMKAMTLELAIISAGDPGAEEPGQFTAFHHGHPNQKAVDLLADPVSGVSMLRPPVTVAVGTKGENPTTHAPGEYERLTIDRAIFSTGWDGDVVVIAGADGTKRVVID